MYIASFFLIEIMVLLITCLKLTRPCRLAVWLKMIFNVSRIFKYTIAKSPCSDLYMYVHDQIRFYPCITIYHTCSATYRHKCISDIYSLYLSTEFLVNNPIPNHIRDFFSMLCFWRFIIFLSTINCVYEHLVMINT